jgi:hypothetical protein
VDPTLDGIELHRRLCAELGGDWEPPLSFGTRGWAFRHVSHRQSILVTRQRTGGIDWLHASMTDVGQVPSYEQLCALHRIVWGTTGHAYQIFVPLVEHVNVHPFALHLFGRFDGARMLPDFTDGSGLI